MAKTRLPVGRVSLFNLTLLPWFYSVEAERNQYYPGTREATVTEKNIDTDFRKIINVLTSLLDEIEAHQSSKGSIVLGSEYLTESIQSAIKRLKAINGRGDLGDPYQEWVTHLVEVSNNLEPDDGKNIHAILTLVGALNKHADDQGYCDETYTLVCPNDFLNYFNGLL